MARKGRRVGPGLRGKRKNPSDRPDAIPPRKEGAWGGSATSSRRVTSSGPSRVRKRHSRLCLPGANATLREDVPRPLLEHCARVVLPCANRTREDPSPRWLGRCIGRRPTLSPPAPTVLVHHSSLTHIRSGRVYDNYEAPRPSRFASRERAITRKRFLACRPRHIFNFRAPRQGSSASPWTVR
jgi:hypothetical protein